MPDPHEPDPLFLDRLEGRIGSELRRRRRVPPPRRERVRTPWVVLGSALFGAAITGATMQAGESWRFELVEARIEAELAVAEGQVAARSQAAEEAVRALEAGALDRDASSRIRLEAQEAVIRFELLESRLEEARASRREPDDGITAPLVERVDYVDKRLEMQADYARRFLALAGRAHQVAIERHESGMGTRLEAELAELDLHEARWAEQATVMRRTLRWRYLADEISAEQAELMDRRIDAQRRAALLRRRLEVDEAESERADGRVRVGSTSPAAASEARARAAETRIRLDLARRELNHIDLALANVEPR